MAAVSEAVVGAGGVEGEFGDEVFVVVDAEVVVGVEHCGGLVGVGGAETDLGGADLDGAVAVRHWCGDADGAG